MGDGGPAVLAAAVRIDRLALAFATVLRELADAPDAENVRAAVAFDADIDGDLDLVVATEDGLRVLLNDGGGRFGLLRGVPGTEDAEAQPARPGGRGPIRGLAVAAGAEGVPPLLAVCTGAGRDLLLRGGITGLEPALTLPVRAGACRAAAFTDVDADGGLDLALLIAAGGTTGLHVLRDVARAPTPDDGMAPPDPEVGSVGSAASTDEAATLVFDRTIGDAAEGVGAADAAFLLTAAGEAVFTLPASLPALPDYLELQLRRQGGVGTTVRPRLIDSEGTAFDGPEVATGPAWRTIILQGPAAWPRADRAEGVPALPITAVALVVAAPAPAEGRLSVDSILSTTNSEMSILIEDFERRSPRYSWPAAGRLLIGDLDADSRDDLLVLRGEAPPVTLLTADAQDGPPFRERGVGLREPGLLTAGVLLDADRDGDLDALLTARGARDRLFVGDGWGRLLDATASSLPVDWSDGEAIAAADLDLDGLQDVVIGNADGTDRLYLARGDGRFADATPDLGFDEVETAAVVLADIDGDGDTDVISMPRDGREPPLIRVAVEPAP